MFICEISIIILICRKLELVGPVPQKIKLPLPNHLGIPNLGYVFIREFGACLTFLMFHFYPFMIMMCIHKQKVKNFGVINEAKMYGLVQQLKWRMLRDLILQQRDSHSLKGDPALSNTDGHLLKLFFVCSCIQNRTKVIILYKISKRNQKDQKSNFWFSLLTSFDFYLHLQTFFVIFPSYRFQMTQISTPKILCVSILDETGNCTSWA